MEWKNVLVTEEKKDQIKIQETKEQNQILERTFERTLTKQLKLSQSNQKQWNGRMFSLLVMWFFLFPVIDSLTVQNERLIDLFDYFFTSFRKIDLFDYSWTFVQGWYPPDIPLDLFDYFTHITPTTSTTRWYWNHALHP